MVYNMVDYEPIEITNTIEMYFDKDHNAVDDKKKAYIIEIFTYDDNGDFTKEVIYQSENYES